MDAPASRTVRLRFRDGVERVIDASPDAPVLDAALGQDVPIFHQCRSGSCGSCVAQLMEGEAEIQPGAASVLMKSEVEAGMRLLCQTRPAGDCAFALDYDSTASAGAPVRVQAFVDQVERIAADAVRLKLELADGDWLDFRPGQYVQVNIPGTEDWRSYSIASCPGELPTIELLIRILPGGRMSEWLQSQAKPDDVLSIEGPYGSFFLREKQRVPHIMIAGGTGLAPMMAMIDTLRDQAGRKPQVLLSFGCATPEGLFHREELDLRRHWMPSLDVRLTVDRGGPAEGVGTGNPVAAITPADIRDPESVAYLCGPPGLIEAARTHLLALGLSSENIHAEQFVPSN